MGGSIFWTHNRKPHGIIVPICLGTFFVILGFVFLDFALSNNIPVGGAIFDSTRGFLIDIFGLLTIQEVVNQKISLTIIFFLFGCYLLAQEQPATSSDGFFNRIFLPSIDVGYQIPTSDLLQGSVRFATSIEYRIRNNNDFFIRLNYDTYGPRYKISNRSNTSNTIEGTVQISDVFLAPGYRLGDKTFRLMFSIMPGIKFYEFPTATLNGQQIQVNQKGKSIFTTSVLTTLEYYFDEKSALTFSLYQNQVWRNVDFWENGRAAFGFSLGFITSLL